MMPADDSPPPRPVSVTDGSETLSQIEAEYTLEIEARCPSCQRYLESVQVVRLLRTRVNFVSTLPRRGQLLVCGECRTILSGSLGGLL